MEAALVHDARLTMPSAFLVRGKSPTIKSTPKGKLFFCILHHHDTDSASYVEMLEQQQSQLVAGLQETYRRLVAGQVWPGAPLSETNGNPLTHDILARLDLLETKQDGSGEFEPFEEDCQKLQQKLLSEGASFVARRGSFGSDSDHSHSHARTSSRSSLHGTPVQAPSQPLFDENFSFHSESPPPVTQSPAPKLVQMRSPIKPSPLHNEAANSNDYLLPSWSDLGLHNGNTMQPQFALQTSTAQDQWQSALENYPFALDSAMDFDDQMMMGNPQYPTSMQSSSMYNLQDWTNEPMEVDFSKFVQVST